MCSPYMWYLVCQALTLCRAFHPTLGPPSLACELLEGRATSLHLGGSSTLYTVTAQGIAAFLLPPSTPPQGSERAPAPTGPA